MKKNVIISCLLLIMMTGHISADSGWYNEGWSNIDFAGKACNSKTTVYSPNYEYIRTWVKMGNRRHTNTKYFPNEGDSVHTWIVGRFDQTCEYGGDADD